MRETVCCQDIPDTWIAPDLIVEDIWSTTTPLMAGESENISFRIKNEGDAPAAATFWVKLRVAGATVGNWPVSGLAAGATFERAESVLMPSPGIYPVGVEVDATSAVIEGNETNNVSAVHWRWCGIMDERARLPLLLR